MKTRVKIRDIDVQWLDARCLNLIAEYSKLAHAQDGTTIRMYSNTCLIDVVDHAGVTLNQELKALYRQIKAALRTLLAAEHLQPKLDALDKYKGQVYHKISDISHYQ